VFIPYQLAYGEQQRGKIPPKSELIFDVDLVDVHEAPPLTAASDLIMPLSEMQDQVVALAKAVPEEKYSWRPGPGVRSFKEVFLHIIYGNELLLNVANGSPVSELQKQIEANSKGEQQTVSKEKLIQMLTDNFAAIRSALEKERAAALGRNADFFGTATTRRGVFTFLDTHVGEHLGQLIAYARMNGIVPPWSR